MRGTDEFRVDAIDADGGSVPRGIACKDAPTIVGYDRLRRSLPVLGRGTAGALADLAPISAAIPKAYALSANDAGNEILSRAARELVVHARPTVAGMGDRGLRGDMGGRRRWRAWHGLRDDGRRFLPWLLGRGSVLRRGSTGGTRRRGIRRQLLDLDRGHCRGRLGSRLRGAGRCVRRRIPGRRLRGRLGWRHSLRGLLRGRSGRACGVGGRHARRRRCRGSRIRRRSGWLVSQPGADDRSRRERHNDACHDERARQSSATRRIVVGGTGSRPSIGAGRGRPPTLWEFCNRCFPLRIRRARGRIGMRRVRGFTRTTLCQRGRRDGCDRRRNVLFRAAVNAIACAGDDPLSASRAGGAPVSAVYFESHQVFRKGAAKPSIVPEIAVRLKCGIFTRRSVFKIEPGPFKSEASAPSAARRVNLYPLSLHCLVTSDF